MECPICKTEFSPDSTEAMPFCSSRCRSADLGRWFGEEYALPHVPDPNADEEPEDNWSGESFSSEEPSR